LGEPRHRCTGRLRSSARWVEDPNDHVHDHHANPDCKRAVGRGGESSNRKSEPRRTRRRERQRAHERRARQIQTEAPVQQRAKASREGRIQGQLGDEFGQHVPDEGGNQPPSAIQRPQLLGPARTQSRRKLYQRQSEAIRGNQRQSGEGSANKVPGGSMQRACKRDASHRVEAMDACS